MGWMHELAHSAGVHTCRIPDCTDLVQVLLGTAPLYTQHPLRTIATY
jgi:hypothetical protein